MTDRARVAILGGGFGGLAAATTLRRLAPDLDVVVIDRAPQFRMGLRKLWLLDGRAAPGEGARDRALLRGRGIDFRQAAVTAIDTRRRTLDLEGERLDWDFLVVAPGSEGRPDLVPGGVEGGLDLYSVEGAAEAGGRLRELDSGRVLIVIAGVPIKCPPAPFEAAFLIDDLLRRTGRRDRVEVEVVSPQPMSIPAAGPAACSAVEGRLGGRGIRFRPRTQVERIEEGRVVAGGEEIKADLVLWVAPHRPPRVIAESGLGGETPWIPVDPATLATKVENVYAVGDVVEMKTGSGLPFPKAGVFAEAAGEVVGENIAELLRGGEPVATFDGHGYCFLEVGEGQATRVMGDFLSSPPDVEVEPAAPEHLAAKHRFEAERLARWFGE